MSAPTLRERIAERLDRHLPESYGDTGCALRCGWSDEGTTDSAGEHLADAVLAVVADWLTEECRLDPAEGMALTVARAQVMRGDEPTPNVAAACIIALDRLTALADRVREGEA